MSRILRRPMFRGGPVDSRGTGITSGLDKPKRGLVNEPGGYAGEKSGMDFLRNALLGKRFTDPNYVSPMKFQSGTGFGFMTPENQAPGLIKINESIYARDPRKGPLGIDEYAKKVTYGGSQEAEMKKSDLEMGEGDIDESETLSSDFYEKLIGQKVDDTPYEGGKVGSDTALKIDTSLLSDNPVLNNQNTANEELTLEEVRDSLGYKKARRRDLGDMFGRGAAAFIGAESLSEGAKKFFEAEAASGPSRLEKIETAAGTFMLKDKAARSRDRAKVELMKADTDYKIAQGKKMDIAESVLSVVKQGLPTDGKLASAIQNATSANTGNKYKFKGVVNFKDLNSVLSSGKLKEGDTLIVKKVVKDPSTNVEKTQKKIIEITETGFEEIFNI